MAEGDGAAIEIDPRRIEPKLLDAGQRLGGEGLVELDNIDLVERQAGPGQRLADRRHRAEAHQFGLAAGDREGADARQHRQPMLAGVILAGHQHRRRAVGQRRGAAGGDRTRGVEGRGQTGQRRCRGLGPDAAIGLDTGNLDNFAIETSTGARLSRLGLGGGGEGVLGRARQGVAPGKVLGGATHRLVGGGIALGQTGMGHRIEAHHRHPGHRFDTATNKGVAGAAGDRPGGHVHRLHRGATVTVDRGGGDAQRQTGEKADGAGDVQPLLAFGKGAADDQILEVGRGDAGAANQFADHGGGEIVGPGAGQAALTGRSERRADIARDDGVLHGAVPSSIPWRRRCSAAVSTMPQRSAKVCCTSSNWRSRATMRARPRPTR